MAEEEHNPCDLQLFIKVKDKNAKKIDIFESYLDFWDAVVDVRDEIFPDLDVEEFGARYIEKMTEKEILEFLLDKIMWTGYFSDLMDICHRDLDKKLSKNPQIKNSFCYTLDRIVWMGKEYVDNEILIIEESHPFNYPYYAG